jgi:hypothetical protein
MSSYIREAMILCSLRTEVFSLTRLSRLPLTEICPSTGGVVLLDLVMRLLNCSRKVLIRHYILQKEQKTLRTYELLIPAGAPGGSGYTDPVIHFHALHAGMLILLFDRTSSSIEDPMYRLSPYIPLAISSLLATWMGP